MSDIQCVVVTPERTEVDVPAVSVTLPMFDGELGILKGHSPLVGRLGYGALRIQTSGSEPQAFFIEGGFVQVANNVVSVLTDKVTPLSKLTAESAEQALTAALDMPGGNPEATLARQKAATRARAMKRLVSAS